MDQRRSVGLYLWRPTEQTAREPQNSNGQFAAFPPATNGALSFPSPLFHSLAKITIRNSPSAQLRWNRIRQGSSDDEGKFHCLSAFVCNLRCYIGAVGRRQRFCPGSRHSARTRAIPRAKKATNRRRRLRPQMATLRKYRAKQDKCEARGRGSKERSTTDEQKAGTT